MISTLLQGKIKENRLSTRAAARQIGIAHTTLTRILNGGAYDLNTVVKMANWLEVDPTTLVNTMSNQSSAIASRITALIEAEPQLAKVFSDALTDLDNGIMNQDDLKEILNFAAYKLSSRRRIDEGNSSSVLYEDK